MLLWRGRRNGHPAACAPPGITRTRLPKSSAIPQASLRLVSTSSPHFSQSLGGFKAKNRGPSPTTKAQVFLYKPFNSNKYCALITTQRVSPRNQFAFIFVGVESASNQFP